MLLTTGGPRLMRMDGHLWPILDTDKSGRQNYLHESSRDLCQRQSRPDLHRLRNLKVRRIGHNAMLEQDAVHTGCEADLAAHVLDVQGRQLSVKGLLNTGAVVSAMPISTWTDMGFDRSDLIPSYIRLAAVNLGAIYLTGRTPNISLQL